MTVSDIIRTRHGVLPISQQSLLAFSFFETPCVLTFFTHTIRTQNKIPSAKTQINPSKKEYSKAHANC